MCWTTQTLPVRRIAKEAIYTYKVIYDYGEFICYSLIMGFVYEYYKLYTQNKAIMPLCGALSNKWMIEEGFHSYRTWLTAKEASEKFSTDPSIRKRIKIVQCIIPKDSTFYKNEKDEIVSDRIIINRILKTDAKLPCAWNIIYLFIIILLSYFILFKVFIS